MKISVTDIDSILRTRGWAGFMKFSYTEGMEIEPFIKK